MEIPPVQGGRPRVTILYLYCVSHIYQISYYIIIIYLFIYCVCHIFIRFIRFTRVCHIVTYLSDFIRFTYMYIYIYVYIYIYEYWKQVKLKSYVLYKNVCVLPHIISDLSDLLEFFRYLVNLINLIKLETGQFLPLHTLVNVYYSIITHLVIISL